MCFPLQICHFYFHVLGMCRFIILKLFWLTFISIQCLTLCSYSSFWLEVYFVWYLQSHFLLIGLFPPKRCWEPVNVRLFGSRIIKLLVCMNLCLFLDLGVFCPLFLQAFFCYSYKKLTELITWISLTQWNYEPPHLRRTGHGGEFWQNVVHRWREWQIPSAFLPWEPHEQYEKGKIYDTEKWTALVGRCPICY